MNNKRNSLAKSVIAWICLLTLCIGLINVLPAKAAEDWTVSEIQCIEKSDHSVTLQWEKPVSNRDSEHYRYEVADGYFIKNYRGDILVQDLPKDTTKVTVNNLPKGYKGTFYVYFYEQPYDDVYSGGEWAANGSPKEKYMGQVRVETNAPTMDEMIPLDEKTFPDKVFRKCLEESFGYEGEDGQYYIAPEEIWEIEEYADGVKSIKGIEKFTKLKRLDFAGADISSIDLSSNPLLEKVALGYSNRLTSVNVSQNPKLESLEISDSGVTKIDLSKNPKLVYLDFDETPLAEVDLSKNTALKELRVTKCDLQTLDLSNNTKLQKVYVEDNRIQTLNVSGLTELEELDATTNQLRGLDLSKCTKLKNLDIARNCFTKVSNLVESLEMLSVADNQLTTLDVSNCKNLKELNCSDNHLTELNFANCVKMETIACDGNSLTKLDADMFENMNRLDTIDLRDNHFAALDITKAYDASLFGYSVSKQSVVAGELYDTTKGTVDLTEYDQDFAYDKVSDITGATIESGKFVINSEGKSANQFSYTYDCGNGESIVVVVYINAKTSMIAIDEKNFPDANFRKKISQTYGNKQGFVNVYDVVDLNLGYTPIADLKGIELFTELRKLNSRDGTFQTADFSKNTKLEEVDFGQCNVRKLDFSKNKALKSFSSYMTGLTDLNFSGCENLESVNCSQSPLSTLELGGCTKITKLDFYNMQLENLDVHTCTALEELAVPGNQLKTLNVAGLKNLKKLIIENNQLTSLDLSGLSSLHTLECYYNEIKALDFKDCVELEELAAYGNQLREIDLSMLTELTRADMDSNEITSCKLPADSKLEILSLDNNCLTTIDLSKQTNLKRLELSSNQFSSIDLSAVTNLMNLSLDFNRFKSIDISKLTKLDSLYIRGNELENLDVSKNTALTFLCIDDNHLVTFHKADCRVISDMQTLILEKPLSDTNNTVDLSNYGVVDVSKIVVDSIKGATLSGTKLIANAKGIADQRISYTYNCGKNNENTEIVICPDQTYDIVYDLDGGVNHPNNPAKGSASKSLMLDAPSKDGYYFVDWYKTPERRSRSDEFYYAPKGQNQTLYVYAKFEKIYKDYYSISYELNGGQNAADNPRIYDGHTDVALLPATRDGYEFLGWYRDKSFAEESKMDAIRPSLYLEGDITLYAKWKSTSGAGTKPGSDSGAGSGSAEDVKVNAPSLSSVKNAVGGVKIAWNAVNGAKSYAVMRSATTSNSWTKVATVAANQTSFLDQTVKSNKSYKYAVKCVSLDGSKDLSELSNAKSVKYIAVPKIKKLTAKNRKVTIKWSKVAGAKKYAIYRKQKGGKWKKLAKTGKTTYTDKNAKKGKTFYYSIQCLDKKGKAISARDAKGKKVKIK